MKKLPKKFTTKKKDTPAFVKATADKQKSPSISRKIPELRISSSWIRLATLKTHWESVFVSFISGILLMAIIVMSVKLWSNVQELQRQEAHRARLLTQQAFWEGVVAKYPDYKDAFFQLAVVSYALGEREDAERAIENVLLLDPNDTAGQELARKIGS